MPDPTYRNLAKVRGDTYQMYFPLPEATITPKTRNTFLGDVIGLAAVPAGVFSEALKGLSYNPVVRASADYSTALPIGWRQGKSPSMAEQSRPSLWLNPKGNLWMNTALDMAFDPLAWAGYSTANKLMDKFVDSPASVKAYNAIEKLIAKRVSPKNTGYPTLKSPNTYSDLIESKIINTVEGELDQEYLTALGKAYESGNEMAKALGPTNDKVLKYWDEYKSLYNMGKAGVPYYEADASDILKLIDSRQPLINKNVSRLYNFSETAKNIPVNRWKDVFRYGNVLAPVAGTSLWSIKGKR